MNKKINRTEEEWKQLLGAEKYRVLREKGTERPFSGQYNLHKEKGIYLCGGCGQELFTSETKFDSGCGWPSFNDVIDNHNIIATKDTSHGMIRTEITCSACGGHLGHVFEDGPLPTGLRYCINSVAIEFEPKKQKRLTR